jgi:hypothetical protein
MWRRNLSQVLAANYFRHRTFSNNKITELIPRPRKVRLGLFRLGYMASKFKSGPNSKLLSPQNILQQVRS